MREGGDRSIPDTAFFQELGPGRFMPNEACVGPWNRESLHGGPPIALLTRALRLHPGDPALMLARVTVEFLGPVPLAECEIAVEVVRPGKRIELLKAEYRVQGRAVLSAQAWRLLRAPGASPQVPQHFNPPPLPEHETTEFFTGVSYFPYGRAMEWRYVRSSFTEPGPALVWARPRLPLLDTEPLHGLDGLLILLDSANGVSAELEVMRHSFVPVDLTLNLHRLPEGPWFGMDARTVIDESGIGMVSTTPFDSRGAVGASLHTLFVRPR